MAMTRRAFLAGSSCAAAAALIGPPASALAPATQPHGGRARIAITLDLEMARNFPRWEDTHWDYEKGNLNDETKRYAVEAARRVKAHGGVVHFFLVGRALEQENVDWLKEIAREGHPIGNHTYDHVYLLAHELSEVQYRFKRAPWLVKGKTVSEVIAENVRLCNAAIKSRLGVEPSGFRAPGGFADGLLKRPDLRTMLKGAGFSWVSTKYPAHAHGEIGRTSTRAVIDDIVRAQSAAQPFTYDDGLVEIPMSPISDIGAFRNERWKLDAFLDAVQAGARWAIDHGAVFDFLAHPSCLYATDPEFRAIETLCDLVSKAGDRAALTGLADIAKESA